MADAPKNGNGTRTTILGNIGRQLIAVLPPAFLLLIIMNASFLGTVMWFVNEQMTARTHLIERLLERCVNLPAVPRSGRTDQD
jgi:hypothetical protein